MYEMPVTRTLDLHSVKCSRTGECMEHDWRYENAKKLQGAEFTEARYVQPGQEWDHDHCIACWQKLAEKGEAPEVLQSGFVTDADDWVCPECFADLGPHLNWSAKNKTE